MLIGGINHDYEDTGAALAEVLDRAGLHTTIMPDIDTGLDALDTGEYDLLTLYTLRWRMLDDDKYIPYREEWAYEISERHRHVIRQHLASGKGLLGMHTASICFDTWDEWPEILGANWQWGTTYHPEPNKFVVEQLNEDHDITRSLGKFEIVDEIYHNLLPASSSVELFSAISTEDGSRQALAWANQYKGGRIVYDSLGHDRGSMFNEGHAAFIQRAATWCTGGQD